MPTFGNKNMISAKPMAMVAMLALAGAVVAQEKVDEQRIAELIEQLNDEAEWEDATSELLRIGEPVIPLLVGSIWSDDVRLRGGKAQARTLAQFGKKATHLVPDLLTGAEESGKRTPEGIVLAIGWLGAYLSTDERAEIQVRLAAYNAREVVLNGRVAIQFSLSPTRPFHGIALANLDLGGEPTVEACIAALAGESPFLRLVSAEKLRQQASPEVADSCRDALFAALEGPHPKWVEHHVEKNGNSTTLKFEVDLDQRIQREAAVALLLMGERGTRMLPAYRLCLSDPRTSIKVPALMAIGSLGEEAAEAIPDLVKATINRRPEVAREAITALGMIGPAAKDAIPTLEKLTEHDDPQLAERAKAALRKIRRESKQGYQSRQQDERIP